MLPFLTAQEQLESLVTDSISVETRFCDSSKTADDIWTNDNVDMANNQKAAPGYWGNPYTMSVFVNVTSN